jgi:flagellar hook-length control protein FliK
MITLPMSRPEQRSESAPAATVPGSSGESPGNAESLAAASAFLPVLMQVLIAPQTQVVCPAPNREESAPMQGGVDACDTTPLHVQVPVDPSAGSLAPAKSATSGLVPALQLPTSANDLAPVQKASEEPLTAEERAGSTHRIQLLRLDGRSLPAIADGAVERKEAASFQKDLPRVSDSGQANKPAGVRQPDLPRSTGGLPAGEQGGSAVQVSFRRSSGTQPADVPRLMADLIAATGRTPGREYSLERSVSPEGPAPAAPDRSNEDTLRPGTEAGPAAKVVQLTTHKELKHAMSAKGDELPEQEPPAPGREFSTAESVTDRTDSGPAKAVPSGRQEAPEAATGSGDRAPAPAQEQPGVVRAGGERPGTEAGDGQARASVHTIVPALQQGRIADIMRGRPLERAAGVQGLPRELVSSVLQRVVRELVITGAKGGTEARLTLKPDSLGELLVHISMEENVMSARIDVTQPAAKAVLDAGMPQLREALSSRGIAVQNIDVFASTDTMPRNTRDQRDGKPKNGGLRRDAGSAAEPVLLPRMLGYNTIELSM